MMTPRSGSDATPETRLRQRGIELPEHPAAPIGNFRNVTRTGRLLYVSGQGPIRADGQRLTGKVGRDVTADEARQSAELVAVNILAAVKVEIGQLSAVERVVKLLSMVNAEPDFIEHPYVIDGCSDSLLQGIGGGGHPCPLGGGSELSSEQHNCRD